MRPLIHFDNSMIPMKKNLLIVLTALAGLSLHGQGTVNFANNSSTAVTNSLTAARVEVGTTFLAGLYYAADGVTDESQFVQIGANTGFAPLPGFIAGGTRTVPVDVAPAGGHVMFQIRAWEAAYGGSYEDALAAPSQNGRQALAGKSNLIRVNTTDANAQPPGVPASLTSGTGLTGFFLTVAPASAPEPSILLLAFTGGLATWLLRRGRIS